MPLTLRILISKEDAPKYLEMLPGTPEMYERLAKRFLEIYEELDAPEPPSDDDEMSGGR